MIGRRRVGKAFLVSETFRERLAFSVTGIQGATKRTQLDNFARQLRIGFGESKQIQTLTSRAAPFKTWLPAFVKLASLPSFVSWAGVTFESICLRHVKRIKRALGISGMYVEAASSSPWC